MPMVCSPSVAKPLWKSKFFCSSKDRQNSDDDHARSLLQHAFYYDYRACWLTLKILGIFPYHIDDRGDLKFSFLSKEMLYSLLVYCVTSMPVLLVLCIRFSHRAYFAGTFDSEICLYMLSFMLVPHLAIPGSHWLHMNRAVAIFKKWRHFETSYEVVMNEKLHLRCCWSSHLYLMPGVLLFTGAVMFEYIIDASDYAWEVVAHLYVLFFLLIHLIILLGIGYRLIQIARKIRLRLMEAIHLNDAEFVPQLCSLWVKFGESCNLLGCLFHRMYGYILIMIFSVSTITWYSLLKSFAINNYQIGLLYQISCLVNNCLWLFFLCECGQRITAESGRKFIRLIATAKPYAKDMTMKTELDSFTSTIASFPVALSINGYVSIDRRLFISIKATMVTYLIVVLQFSQDYSADAAAANNTLTNVNGSFFSQFATNRKCLFAP